MRIFRNEIYGHIASLYVTDADFKKYWNDLEPVLVRLGVDSGEIARLKLSPVDMEQYIQLVNEWKENEADIKYFLSKHVEKSESCKAIIAVLIFMIFVSMILFGMVLMHVVPPWYTVPDDDWTPLSNISNSSFFGRQWYYRELGDRFVKNKTLRGVLTLADLGWGKSAIMHHLINAPNTVPFIHKNIIASHFCKGDKRTRMGDEFVKCLVHMISNRSEEFESIAKRATVRTELNDRCKNNPNRCFEIAILEPLNEMSKPDDDAFILIDALNECREKKRDYDSEIVDILYRYVPLLPSWVKLVVTSTNDTSVRGKMTEIGLSVINVDATDALNSEDIRSYAEQRILENDFKVENGSKSMRKELIRSIDLITKNARGNFLYVQKLFDYWKDHPEQINLEAMPEISNHYGLTFRSRYKRNELKYFTPLLEVLLASQTPPTRKKLDAILKHVDSTYDADEVIDEILPHLKISSDETVRFFHQSFVEWLEKHTERIDGFKIITSRGHQHIAEYLFYYYKQKENSLQLEGLSELSMHVVFGGMIERHVRNLEELKFERVFDRMSRCILHELAGKRESTPVIGVFIERFKDVDIVDLTYWTPSFYAISAGNYKNLEVLINNRADVDISISNNMLLSGAGINDEWMEFGGQNMYATRTLDLAIPKGNLEIVQLLITEGAKADSFALYQAAQNNHSRILKFLLDREVKDECLPCERHSNRRETALDVAVSSGFINIVEMLLLYKVDSLECKSHRGRTPLIRAVENNNSRMAILLIEGGANLEAKCEDEDDIWLDPLYCPCGNKAIHLSAMFDSWEIARELIKKNADAFSKNCMGWTAVELAAFYDNVNFVRNFFSMYKATEKHVVNNKTVLSYLAACGSAKTLDLFAKRSDDSVLTGIYDYGMTLLHLATLSSIDASLNNNGRLCSIVDCNTFLCPYKDYMHKPFTNLYEKRSLETIKLLTEQAPQIVNKKDQRGRTALHYAALLASTHIVRHLERLANWGIKDESGQTPLELALTMEPLPPLIFLSDRMTDDNVFHTRHNTAFDETISRLIVLHNSTISCDEHASWLVGELIRHELPLSLYSLFKMGVNVSCSGAEHFKRYLMKLYLEYDTLSSIGVGLEIIEVFKIFELNIRVECGIPFNQSQLHLLMYLKLGKDVGNVFQPSVNNVSSPFQRLVFSQGFRILDNCFDKEGFLPIHRAVQGENIDAIEWLIKVGVDVWKETKTGWTALDLVLKWWSYDYTRVEFEEIFISFTKTAKYESQTMRWCNTALVRLSPLHIAASDAIGKLRYVHQQTPRLPLTCANKHKTQPLYIVYLYHLYILENYNWPESKRLFQNLGLSVRGKPVQYPEQRAEHHLIFNYLYETPHVNLRYELNLEDIFQCPGISEVLPQSDLVNRQIKRCYNRCGQSAYQASQEFLYIFDDLIIGNKIFDPVFDGFVDIVAQMAELRYRSLKMLFNFKVSSKLWRKISKAYRCSHRCRCLEIMQLLRKRYINKIIKNDKDVEKLMAERMGWNNSYPLEDLLYRWPFGFFLEKALMNKTYDYLEILSPNFKKQNSGNRGSHIMDAYYGSLSGPTAQHILRNGNCSEIVHRFLEHFIARREQSTRVGKYVMKRMGMNLIQFNNKKITENFKFSFLLKKALIKFKVYEHLKFMGHCLDRILHFKT